MCRELYILKQYSNTETEIEDNSIIDPSLINVEEFVSSDHSSIDWKTQVNLI